MSNATVPWGVGRIPVKVLSRSTRHTLVEVPIAGVGGEVVDTFTMSVRNDDLVMDDA